MKKSIVFILFVFSIVVLACQDKESQELPLDYFSVDGKVFQIVQTDLIIDYKSIRGMRHYSSSLWLKTKGYNYNRAMNFDDISESNLNDDMEGVSVILINTDIGTRPYGNDNPNDVESIQNEARNSIYNLNARDIRIGCNYQLSSHSFEYTGVFKTLTNESSVVDDSYKLHLNGLTSDGKEIECHYSGSESMSSVQILSAY